MSEVELHLAVDMTSSFEGFFADQHADLFAALWLITRDRQEAEEILQEAFLRLWERWDRVAGLEDPEGYLYRTAMNVFRSRARRAAVALRRTIRPTHANDAFDAVERREVMVQALGTLTPRERAAVVLTNIVGLSSEEAAQALHIRPATVRVLAARGRERMQKEVQPHDP
jgi:RNA polymerase sigma-70 factor, ECF subfamily